MKTVLIIIAICVVVFVICFWDGIVEVWKYYRNNKLNKKGDEGK